MEYHNHLDKLTTETFINHKPDGEQCATMDTITANFVSLWRDVGKIVPDGANKTLMYRHLEDACMRAKKAVILDTPFKRPKTRAHI